MQQSEKTETSPGSVGEVCAGRFTLVYEVPRQRHHHTRLYQGTSAASEEPVAVKLERPRPDGLQKEAEILQQLARPGLPQGFLSVHFWGVEDNRNCLVTELLGRSLWHCTQENGKLSVQDTLLIAQQALYRLEYLHSKGIVHRDITPRNFVFGLNGKVHHLYLTEFGSSKAYWNGTLPGRHIMQKTGNMPVGALPYMSVNAHHGLEHSRRDDLESVAYMLVDCMRPLPWAVVDAPDDAETAKRMRHQKEAAEASQLCKGLPEPLELLLLQARELEFKERPDYKSVQSEISHLIRQHGLKAHELSWLQELDPATLVPLEKPERPLQPDEIMTKRSTSWLSHMITTRQRRMCFSCGCAQRVAE